MSLTIDTKPYREHIQKLQATRAQLEAEGKKELNLITDRHLARIKKNTDVGDSPDSPTLRNTWDRSGVQQAADGLVAEVFNPTEYAPWYEYGHRQTPGRLVFIELMPGQQKYGQAARQVTSGPHRGKWGIYIQLKKSYVRGRFVMTDSEAKAQQELDAAVRRLEKVIKGGI